MPDPDQKPTTACRHGRDCCGGDPALCYRADSRAAEQIIRDDRDAGERQNPTTIDRTSVIVKLTLLIGACRQPRVTKRQIEESLERYIRELEGNA